MYRTMEYKKSNYTDFFLDCQNNERYIAWHNEDDHCSLWLLKILRASSIFSHIMSTTDSVRKEKPIARISLQNLMKCRHNLSNAQIESAWMIFSFPLNRQKQWNPNHREYLSIQDVAYRLNVDDIFLCSQIIIIIELEW